MTIIFSRCAAIEIRGDFMTAILTSTVFTALFGGAVWMLYLKENIDSLKKSENNAMYIIAVLAAGLIAHVIGALCYYGHKTDMACFVGWSDSLFNDGLGSFYTSEGFHDYPPGYVYVMYILGALKALFDPQGGALQLLIKMPAIIADLVSGYIVYRVASKKFGNDVSAVLTALVVLNPAYIMDSAIWGQVDSILALFCLLTVYFAAERKLIPAFFMFAIGILIKPQALFFAPIVILGIIDTVWLQGFTMEKFVKNLLGGLAAIAFMFISFLPFGVGEVIKQYTETMGQYEYMTVNAFNIYGAIGKNWEKLGTASTVFGYLMIAVVVAYSVYVFLKSKSPAKYYICSFILAFGMYMMAIKMHERYAFPGIIMLMFALIAVPTTKNFIMYGLFSLTQYFNMAWILFIYQDDINKYFRSPVVAAASVINILFSVFCIYTIQKETVHYKEPVKKNNTAKKGSAPVKKPQKLYRVVQSISTSKVFPKIVKADIIIIAAISVVYGVIALYNLGNTYAPQTETVISDGAVTVDLGSEQDIEKTEFYLGARQLSEDRMLTFSYLDDNKNEVYREELTSGSVFAWTFCDVGKTARYVEISTNIKTTESDQLMLKEVCFLDGNGEQIEPVNTDATGVANLFDERWMMAEGKSFMYGTYFDEIYHARTAYEFIHHLSVYEWTHPPLGKVFIGLGILIFGMVPFGWRIVGTIFGIFMIPIIYLFAKRMLKYTWLAAAVCLLFTFDFMHFAQTRIATIDVYVTFFIMLMYYFMYKYYRLSFYDTPLKKTLIPLGLSGIFFGLGVASKWTGLYAGAGLAVIFFYTLYERYNEYRIAMRNPRGTTNGISHKHITDSFKYNTIFTLGFCVVFFILIPICIYCLSYIPYLQTPSGHGLKTIIDNANSMFTYHSKTVADSTHPYSSHWFEWPIMYRPIWYFSNTVSDGIKQGISSFGNPAVWWIGIGAVAYMTALAIVIPLKKRAFYGVSKFVYGGLYALVFAIFCVIAAGVGSGNEKLERLFPCIVLYSSVFVGIFFLVLSYEEFIKQESNKIALFLVIAYFAELMPWMAVVRTTYIYHYFPCVPFTVLMIGYSIKTFYDNCRNKRAVIITTGVYVAAALILFAMFYPVLSGQPCEYSYAETWLKWFKSWVLL